MEKNCFLLFPIAGSFFFPLSLFLLTPSDCVSSAASDVYRREFLASRTNAWLSLPMLFLMATSHGDYVILGK